MPTDIPLPGYLGARLGLARANLAPLENPPRGNQPPRLDPERFFTLEALAAVMRSHPGLMLDQLLPFDRAVGWEFNSEIKGPLLREFARLASDAYARPDAPWRLWSRRHRRLYPNGQDSRRAIVRPRWRWVVGLGNQTILETGLTLHHTYGIPYLPGSGLKGLTQALVARGLEPEELRAELGEPETERRAAAEVALFGTQQHAGEVVFLGAVPAEDERGVPRLSVDVMTPHFPQFYGDNEGRRAPLEVEDPTPVPFLVAAGGSYDLTLSLRRSAGRPWLELALKLCLAALDELGVGGKTAKGYGYFVEG